MSEELPENEQEQEFPGLGRGGAIVTIMMCVAILAFILVSTFVPQARAWRGVKPLEKMQAAVVNGDKLSLTWESPSDTVSPQFIVRVSGIEDAQDGDVIVISCTYIPGNGRAGQVTIAAGQTTATVACDCGDLTGSFLTFNLAHIRGEVIVEQAGPIHLTIKHSPNTHTNKSGPRAHSVSWSKSATKQ